jgi:hypothetical protein
MFAPQQTYTIWLSESPQEMLLGQVFECRSYTTDVETMDRAFLQLIERGDYPVIQLGRIQRTSPIIIFGES